MDDLVIWKTIWNDSKDGVERSVPVCTRTAWLGFTLSDVLQTYWERTQ